MKSVLVEALRNGSAVREGILQPDTRYFVTMADEPAYLSETNLTFRRFRELLKQLEYRGDAIEKREQALRELSSVVSKMMRCDTYDWLAANGQDKDEPIQVDLVLNPFELAALPFEVACGRNGEYLFRQSPPVVITRRVRGAFRVHRRSFATRPRVLFVWASPADAGPTVPHAEHFDALRTALSPWIEPRAGDPRIPDYRKVLEVLERATLPDLRQICAKAVADNKPFTHIHILAHGCQIGPEDDPFEGRFGLAFHGENGAPEAVSPEDLADAIAPLVEHTLAVTLAACYGANQTNPLIPQGGLAFTLHECGIPIVLGSQWPLTFDGSRALTRTFYSQLMRGDDARRALHDARLALFQCKECLHDWASVVGYMSLPEGYADFLDELSLKQALAAMDTASKWADELVATNSNEVAAFEPVVSRLEERIADLKRILAGMPPRRGDAVAAENRGLLGSVHKRLAELLHHWNRQAGPDDARSARLMESLRESMHWYHEGFQDRISAHWLATQYLSLDAALNGRIGDPILWHIARRAAESDARTPEEYWAWGSLAELLLLAGAAGQPANLDGAHVAIDELKARAEKYDRDRFAIPSTRRQLRRYTNWWTSANGFFPGTADLATAAGQLLARLEA